MAQECPSIRPTPGPPTGDGRGVVQSLGPSPWRHAAEQTVALLAEQAEAGRRAQSPEAQAARIAAMARLKGAAA